MNRWYGSLLATSFSSICRIGIDGRREKKFTLISSLNFRYPKRYLDVKIVFFRKNSKVMKQILALPFRNTVEVLPPRVRFLE
jgi:hypothetical protein